MRHSLFAALLFAAPALAGDGNRLAYLDECNPYYPSRTFPKLITPMWVGEEGVDAVVVLAIDDMRGSEKWEKFLRPILNRLKKIDGRAPVSIMTCNVDPKDPQLQRWLKEGLSLEVHTIDHPCPLLQKGDLAKAKSTYDRCVDLMNSIPNNKPVAFRMPCCDSINSLSPRFFTEIFEKKTQKGNFLSLDSSVFQLFTPNDPDLPRELVFDADGRERFRKYIPEGRSFVNTIEDYPYPYVIDRLCWEFPCMMPSDWEAQYLHKPNNPITVRDWKAALDCTVIKKGVFTFVFHPHGWIKAEQLVDFIDYAQSKYGKRVKFLNLKECEERLTKNVLGGQRLRSDAGFSAMLADLNNDGYIDVSLTSFLESASRIWSPKTGSWRVSYGGVSSGAIGVVGPDSHAAWIYGDREFGHLGMSFKRNSFAEDESLTAGLQTNRFAIYTMSTVDGKPTDQGVRLRDLDGDGICELIAGNDFQNVVFRRDLKAKKWVELPFTLPTGGRFVNNIGRDYGLRLIDLDGDGKLDIIFSNEKEYGVYLFTDMQHGWSRKVMAGKAGEPGALPMISRNGTNNGFWVHSRTLWWQNENTDHLPNHVDRRTFNEILKDVEPTAKSPEAALKSIQVKPGFQVELMAAEPLVQDPISFAFGPDGKLWVVEMGDYPLGTDGKGKFGGRIKYLESTKGDGKYDKATVFLDGVGFPTGVLPWRNGILVTCAPEIFFVENNNGKPGKKEVLFSGFIQGNQQHRVNTLAWGLDNWIYVANGDSGGIIKSHKTGKTVNISGRDFKFRPDTGEMEAVTGTTQYGRSRDDWGNWFGGNNSNPMWHYVLDDHYLRRNPYFAPPSTRSDVPVTAGAARVYPISRTLPRFNDLFAANRFTSACSPIVYRDTLFYSAVDSYRTRNSSRSDPPSPPLTKGGRGGVAAGGIDTVALTFVCEPVHNLIHREIMRPEGVTFKSQRALDERESEFLASSDNWFRPVRIETGPDGCLWIADMYRAVIEHPQWIPRDWQKRLDLRAGHDMGRIYRVSPVGVKPRAIPRLDKLDTAGLVAALDSPNGWQRDMAQMMLLWKNDKSAVPLLEKKVEQSAHAVCEVHALYTLAGMGKLSKEMLLLALNDANSGVRRHGVRLSEGIAENDRRLLELIDDSEALGMSERDELVNMQKAYSFGLIRNETTDPYLTAAFLSAISRENLRRVVERITRSRGLSARLFAQLIVIAEAMKQPSVIGPLFEKLGMRDQATGFSTTRLKTLAELLDILDQRGYSINAEALRKLAPLFSAARKLSDDRTARIDGRATALALLAREPDQFASDLKKLIEFLNPQTPPELQTAAVSALGRVRETQAGQGRVRETQAGEAQAREALIASWKGLGPARRAQIVEILLQRNEGAKAILDAIEKHQINANEIDAPARQRLLTHRVAEIRKSAEKAFAGSINSDRQKVIDAFQASLTLKGDGAKGREIFAKTCAACHKLNGVGNEVGPDLAALAGRTKDYLMIAILDPNRAVEARYVNYLAETKNGLSFAGVLLNETGTSITIVGPEGKSQTILRNNLESLTSTGRSAMPEGVEKDWTPQDLANLLAYVHASAPALKPRSFPNNKPELVQAEADGSLILKASQAEIYGNNLVFEQQYRNLGYWARSEDFAAWSVRVPKAGKYVVEFDYACDNGTAGNRFAIETEGGTITGKVVGTGNWDTYRQAKVGELTLPAGEQRLTMRSDGPIRGGAMIDLKAIRLKMVK